jgi:hypothetical protein
MEDLDVDGRIKLKWILKRLYVRIWTGFVGLRMGPMIRFANAALNLQTP